MVPPNPCANPITSLHHPVKGMCRFAYATFQAEHDPALRLAVYTPAFWNDIHHDPPSSALPSRGAHRLKIKLIGG